MRRLHEGTESEILSNFFKFTDRLSQELITNTTKLMASISDCKDSFQTCISTSDINKATSRLKL